MMMINPFVELISKVIELYSYVVIAYLILTWLISFSIVNRYQPAVQKTNIALSKLCEPPLRKIRKFLPDLGAIDISPIILILLLQFLDHALIYYSIRL